MTSPTASPVAPPGPAAGGLARDDTLRLLDSQTRVLELIAGGAPLGDVLSSVVTALEGLLDAARCSILLLDNATGTLRHGAAPSLPAQYVEAIDGLGIGPDAGSCGTAAHTGHPVVAEDVMTDPRWSRYRETARPHGLRSCWSTPIRARSGIVGTFAVYTGHPHRPTPREELLVERLTHLASVAIDHAGLFGALAESEERFRHAFEDNAVGMALTDLDGRFVKVNEALARMLGRGETALLGTALADVVAPVPSGDPGAPAPVAGIVGGATQGSAHLEALARRPDGTVLRLAVTASAVRAADGVPRLVSLNLLDVTQRDIAEAERRGRREAEVARSVAEAASRAKTDFLSAMSHEIRTPLQAIRGFTELLRTLELPPDRRTAALEHIEAASAHVTALVDDVLDISRIEAGALPVEQVRVDVGLLFHEVVELLAPVAAAGAVTLVVGPGPAVHARADERRLRQVLINLVSNGIRYNRTDGTVTLTAAGPDDDGCVVLRVEDTGRGIPEDLRERLFVPFDRLGSELAADGGIGLGLSLAHGLTTTMGGRLGIESAVGVGTTVTLTLPAG
ncbi:GAF domain-containing sensor histidine kinase [Kineosporia sp. A_224]|uniref:GAF domain-containing sensor histidine kinase n=1 Tax=Kineosporia sp. A_224 TaxID=1962180 RepID=UPI000B4AF432|nr:GAF domain-containing sensor histidine kinase [Kineosporia sp. A_224]